MRELEMRRGERSERERDNERKKARERGVRDETERGG